MSCVFCKIIKKEIPTKIVKEDDSVLVIEDISPKAPIHYLVMPKKHVESILHLESEDKDVVWHMLEIIRDLAKELKLESFNTISNNGKDAGQSVMHMHWHLISGRNIYEGEL